jgi:hypothetical protein
LFRAEQMARYPSLDFFMLSAAILSHVYAFVHFQESFIFVSCKYLYGHYYKPLKEVNMKKRFFKMMDYCFDMLMILTGEEQAEKVNINHIL